MIRTAMPLLGLLLLGSRELRADDPSPSCEAAANPAAVLESEELMERLRRPLAALSRDVRTGPLPGAESRRYCAPRIYVVDLAANLRTVGRKIVDIDATRWSWRIEEHAKTVATKDLSLWTPFLQTVARFEHGGFYNVRGAFEGDARSSFRTVTGFKGLATLQSGKIGQVAAMTTILWRASDAPGCGDVGWRIAALETTSFRVTETDSALFADVLPAAVSAAALRELGRSKRDEVLIEWISSMRRGETTFEASAPEIVKAYQQGTNPIAMGQISVVDLNQDGFDDFCVTGSGHQALFFRNRGDGRFDEIGADLGLDLDDVHAVVFADFDNDGDKDAFVSYLARGTRYLVQKDGRFVERTDGVDGAMPSWVVCMSVIDYDNDGLLDLYCGAWAGEFVGFVAAPQEKARREGKPVDYSFPGLGEEDGRELMRRLLDDAADPILARPGPPNVLLKNLGGGRFARTAASRTVASHYNTLATTWSDFDRDGDMDLYVTNEAGPNQLYRNLGDGTFADVSDAVTGEVGYGMGASWGDYDNDGRPDLYVTNMYSKAGIRIAGQLQASESIRASARGNSLIRNGAESFERIADTPVEAADFGWGGAFADFNNDGRLDIYAPAGYVTIPEEVAIVGDT